MKRLLFIILNISLAIASAECQTITGKIVSYSDQRPLSGATVGLVELDLEQASDAQGNFSFDVPAGAYTLSATYQGFQRVQIRIRAPYEGVLIVSMSANANELQAVEIIGRNERGYKNTSSFSGTKTETLLKYVPQAISYVTKEVIDDQQAFKASDVLKNLSGTNQFSYYDNDIAIRGFRAGSALVNGLRKPTGSWSQSLLPNVERVEVIKGPASALFANTDPGGTVNTVTKKPLNENRKSISFATGSYNTFRLSSDFTGPMNESRTLLYRLNLAYQNAESFRVLQGGKDMVIAPSISFVPNDRTQVNIDFVYSDTKAKLDRGQPIFGASAGTDLYSTPISFAIGKMNDFSHETTLFTTASLRHKFTEYLTFNASYMKHLYDEDLLEHRTSNRYAVDADGNEIPTLMEMQTIRRMRKNYNDNITLYFVADLQTGPVQHKLLAGYDYIQNLSPVGGSTYNASGYRNAANNGFIRTYNKNRQEDYLIVNNMPVPNVPHFNLENPDYSITEISGYFNVSSPAAATRYFVNGVYLQDQIKWGKLQALLSLRQEYYTDILNYKKNNSQTVEQKALIPRIGLVYTPIDPLNLYATLSQGYQPQGAGTIGDPATYGGPFDPLISKMLEAGAKMEFIRGGLAVNVAAYRIEQNNILMNANDAGNPDLLRQIGQQQAKGVELDVYGKLLPNLSLTANFSYNETKITKSDKEEEIGQLLPNAPKTQGGAWIKYTFTNTVLKGIGIGLGSNYVAQRNTFNAALFLPAYTIFDAALYYNVDKFRLSVNLNNLANKTHWTGGYDFNRLYPGAPRNFLVGVGYTF